MRDACGIASPAEPVGVAGAVEALVRRGGSTGRSARGPRRAPTSSAPAVLWPLISSNSSARETPRLAQDALGHRHLADVVQHRRDPQHAEHVLAPAESRRDRHRVLGDRARVLVLGVHAHVDRVRERRRPAQALVGAGVAAIRAPVGERHTAGCRPGASAPRGSIPSIGNAATPDRARGALAPARRSGARCSRARPTGSMSASSDRELVAADPPDRVGRPDRPLERLHDPAQQLVAGRVSVPVVDLLEVIDVEHQHRPADVHWRAARVPSTAIARSSKPRRFRQPVSGSARETSISAIRWRSWLRACHALIAPVHAQHHREQRLIRPRCAADRDRERQVAGDAEPADDHHRAERVGHRGEHNRHEEDQRQRAAGAPVGERRDRRSAPGRGGSSRGRTSRESGCARSARAAAARRSRRRRSPRRTAPRSARGAGAATSARGTPRWFRRRHSSARCPPRTSPRACAAPTGRRCPGPRHRSCVLYRAA